MKIITLNGEHMSGLELKKIIAAQLSEQALADLVSKRYSFQVLDIYDISLAVSRIEHEIEKQGLRCRVYSEYRSTVVASAAIPTGLTQAVGLATAVGIGVHNLFTINPDYEIGKNKLAKTVTAIFKK